MTFEEFSTVLQKNGISMAQAGRDIGITPQGLNKWKRREQIPASGELYIKLLARTTGNCQDVLKERGKEYGSFEDNILGIAKYKDAVNVVYKSKPGKEILVNTAVDYVKYMLALKTVRSQSETISRPAYADCITDFVNYYNLLEDLLKANCEFYTIEFSRPYTIKSALAIAKDALLLSGM